MARQSGSSDKSFGYLTAIETADYGFFGGYLVVSQLGRPLEFHCTAPIRPSRAQQILYGPTLEPYLLGEQISGALLNVAKLTPCVILTDCEATLHARARFATPMALLRGPADHAEQNDIHSLTPQTGKVATSNAGDATSLQPGSASGDFEFGKYQVHLPYGYDADESHVTSALTLLAKHVELMEPLARIREAIGEAQRIGGRGTETHDQAA